MGDHPCGVSLFAALVVAQYQRERIGRGTQEPRYVDGADKVRPGRAPDIGEHTDQILRGAGYDEAAIAALRAGGIVA